MTHNKNILYLFNLSMDLDNPVLATTNLWVNEFAKKFELVYVYSTHVGKYDVPKNVKVTELGGGTLKSRIIAISRVLTATVSILTNYRRSVVFHHQSPFTSVFPGILLRLAGIKQGLWYSHSSKPISLILGSKISNCLFSSSPASLPIKSKKANFFGHGIDTSRAESIFKENINQRSGILYLGRISPIKNLEECLNALADSEFNQINFVATGPTNSKDEYLHKLKNIAAARNICFERENPIDHELVFEKMSLFSMFFSGMKNSVDKSCLEAAATGCFVITTDTASADLSGMSYFWEKVNGEAGLPELGQQIRIINSMNPKLLDKYRSDVSSRAIELNSASNLISKISFKLKEV